MTFHSFDSVFGEKFGERVRETGLYCNVLTNVTCFCNSTFSVSWPILVTILHYINKRKAVVGLVYDDGARCSKRALPVSLPPL